MGDTSGVSIRRRSSARRPGSFSFILTGFDKNEKGEQNCLILKIKSLKGLYSEVRYVVVNYDNVCICNVHSLLKF